MPIMFFEGMRDDERLDMARRNMERRFYALAAAVKDHEAQSHRRGNPLSRADADLYRRLRQLTGEPGTSEYRVEARTGEHRIEPPTAEQQIA